MDIRAADDAVRPRFRARPRRRRPVLELEALEVRTLPSVAFQPPYLLFAPQGTAAGKSTPYASAFTPAGIEQAYGIDQLLLNGDNGSGETIAIVDAYDNPDFVSSSAANFSTSDLHQFDVKYNLPEPSGFFTKVNQSGGTTYPATDPAGAGKNNWEAEEALDVEWVHALAPQAHILMVEANDNSNNLFTAAAWAGSQSGAQVVSMSWGSDEFSGETGFDSSTFVSPASHGVTFLAATGDNGQPGGYPAFSPNVVAIGGTTLTVSNGSYSSESGWSGSGGGISVDETQPAYQAGLTPSSTQRTTPDVAFDADPNSGVSVYDSYNGTSSAPWYQFGGTSFATPSWAALVASADQVRASEGLGSLDGLSQTLPILYTLPAADFHDVTTGNNGFAAGPGYDLVTGIGTPVANKLVPDLAALRVDASTPAGAATVTTPPTTFSVTFSDAINPASLQASALKVNGMAATSVTLDATDTIATFNFTTSPVATQGPQTMTLAAGAVNASAKAATTNVAFTATFYYDTLTLAVTSTTPVSGGTIAVPVSNFTYDVTFDEPIDPATAGTGNLTLSQGSVTAAIVQAGNQTVAYTLTGLTTPGTLTVTLPAGTVKDQYDNIAFTAFTGTYLLDAAATALPAPVSVAPAGSLIYMTSATNLLLFAGDSDRFTLAADPGQTLTVLVTPSSTALIPSIQLMDPSATLLGSASAAAAGQNALLQTVATTTSGTYTVTVSGLASTTGSYTIEVVLDAALEAASEGLGFDTTRATAQNLTAAFVPLETSLAAASRAAVIGSVGQDVLNASASGWWDNTGSHTAGNLNYVVGQSPPTVYRDFFVFNLGSVTPTILSARLNVTNPSDGYSSPLSSDTFGLFDVSTSIASLEATGRGQRGIFNDLGSGTSYGSLTVNSADNGETVSTPLNAAGVTALNTGRGGQFALGGALTSLVGSDTQFLFSDTGNAGDTEQLVLTLVDTRFYAVSLTAGELITVGLKNLTGSGTSLTLQDGSGNTLATGTTGAADVDEAISNFAAPAAGTYYVVVGGSSAATYSLVVVRDATFDTKNNAAMGAAQAVTGATGVLGDVSAATPTDWYKVTLAGAQNALKVETGTPLGGPNQVVNTLNPVIQLYNASSTLIASGTLLPDGRNEALLATGLSAGTNYFVKVATGTGTQGEYFLGVTPLQTPAIATSPSSQAVVAGQPATFTAAANGSPTPTVQWMVSTNNGVSYAPVNGATSSTFTIPATSLSQTGNLYEAVFSNVAGSATAGPATLTVETLPAFTSGTPPSSIAAGQTYSFPFTASGSPMPTLSASNLPSWLTFTPATGVLSGSPTLATTYTNLAIIATNVAGSATTTFNLTVTPGAVDHLSVTAMPGSIVAGGSFGLTVTAQDLFNNATSDVGNVTVSSNDPLVAAPVSLTTTFSGGTAFAVGSLKTATPTGWTIKATDATSHSGTAVVTVTPAAANQLAYGVQPANATAGTAIAPAVTVKIEDPFGNLVTSDSTDTVTVGVASGPGGFPGNSTTTATVSGGVAAFSNLVLNRAGSYTLSETATGGLTGSASNSFTVFPGTANQLEFGQQPTTTTAGAAIAAAVTVQIEDQFGNLLTSDNTDTVTIGIASGPGPFTGASTTTATAGGGIATFSNLHLNTAGTYTLSETASGSLTGSASNSFTVTPAAANQLVFGVQPSNATAGAAITPAVTVQIEDQFGNLESTDNTDTVTVGIASGPGTFSGTSTSTGIANTGVATFANLRLNLAGSYTLSELASSSLTGAVSNSFTVTPSAVNQLVFGQQPTSTTAGTAILPAVTVQFEDQFGNLVSSDSTDMVTVGIATGPGTFSGSSTTSVTASAGIASFANLRLNTAGSYTLSETASGSLAGPNSSSFTITPGAPNQLAFGQQPTNTASGNLITLAVTVKIEDQFGNLVSGDSSDQLTIGIATGPGTATIASGAAGATESGNTVTITTTTGTGYTTGQTVVIAGVSMSGYSGTFTITSVPTATTFTYTDPTSGLANAGGGTATVTPTFNAGSTTSVTASAGLATFTNLALGSAGSYTLSISATGSLSGPASSPFNVTLVVSAFTATPTGFTVTFSQAFNPATINLTGPTGTDGPVAVTLIGSGPIGPISGSLYLDPTDTQLTFVKTVVVGANGLPVSTGSLPLGTYMVTLVSGSSALTTANGVTLDGNSDGTAGDNYTATFHVVSNSPAAGDVLLPSTAVLATAPDFARGPLTPSVTIAGSGGAVESGNTVTITTTLAHAFSMGQTVTITGVGLSGYDGTFTITSVPSSPNISGSPTTFTYTDPTSGLGASGGGTANVPAVNVANNSGNGIPIDLTVLAPVQTITFSSAITTGTTGTFKLGFNSQTTANITVGTVIKAPTGSASTSGASESGTTATIRTATVTGVKVGESVTINGVNVSGYNGTFTVTGTPSTTSFTYTAGSSGLGLSGNGTWNLSDGTSLATAMQAGLGALSVVGGAANVAVVQVGSSNAYTVTFATAVANPNLMTVAANTISTAPTITIVNPNAPAGVSMATLVLRYNANLLTITGATVNPALAGATLTVSTSGTGTAAQATITFTSSGGVNLGALGSVNLGGLIATVPNTAPYKSKMLLHFVSESLNGGALTAVGVDGYQLVAYQGDTDGNGSFSGNDQTLLNLVAGGTSPGFAAYRQVDPILIGGLSSGTSISATDSGLLASYLNGVAVPQVPDQTGVVPSLFVPGPDPVVSIPRGLSVAADGTMVVPVNLDDARPLGSTGLTQAELALTYDPSVFTVSAADVQLGTIPLSSSGWTLSVVVDAVTGQLAITLLSQTPIATAIGGSLVTIAFHQIGMGLSSGTTPIALAASVDPNGQGMFVTALFDTDNRFILSPAPANAAVPNWRADTTRCRTSYEAYQQAILDPAAVDDYFARWAGHKGEDW